MSPGASVFHWRARPPGEERGAGWAAAIAILFAAVAATSFALDQSLTLSSLPAPPAASDIGRQ